MQSINTLELSVAKSTVLKLIVKCFKINERRLTFRWASVLAVTIKSLIIDTSYIMHRDPKQAKYIILAKRRIGTYMQRKYNNTDNDNYNNSESLVQLTICDQRY